MTTERGLQAHHHLRRAIEAATGRAWSGTTPALGRPSAFMAPPALDR